MLKVCKDKQLLISVVVKYRLLYVIITINSIYWYAEYEFLIQFSCFLIVITMKLFLMDP